MPLPAFHLCTLSGEQQHIAHAQTNGSKAPFPRDQPAGVLWKVITIFYASFSFVVSFFKMFMSPSPPLFLILSGPIILAQ